jgi:hypothetical protein
MDFVTVPEVVRDGEQVAVCWVKEWMVVDIDKW